MGIEVRDSGIEGKGIFATAALSKHSIIAKMTYEREVTDDAPVDPQKGENARHQHPRPDGKCFLISKPYGYFNHSCSPNSYLYSVNRNYYFIAMHDIKRDQEITMSYELHFPDTTGIIECNCRAPNCRGTRGRGFFDMTWEEQLGYLPYIDPWFVETNATRFEELFMRQISE